MGLTFTPDTPEAAKPAPAPAFTPAPKPEYTGPLYQPAMLTDASLGDGIRNTIPADILAGWTRPDADRTFTMRQLTLGERCACIRLAAKSPGELPEQDALEREYVIAAVRSIGDNPEPTTADLVKWIDDLGWQGWKFVMQQYKHLHEVPAGHDYKLFEASKRVDITARRFTYTLPASFLARKRWHSRTLIDARWVSDYDKDTLVDRSHWVVRNAAGNYEPAAPDIAAKLSADLTFTFKEAKQGDSAAVMDLAEDPDDVFAVRQLSVMHSLCSIGGRDLTNSPADLTLKRQWLEDIGCKNNLIVTGTWVSLHEVDHAKIASFLESAEALD